MPEFLKYAFLFAGLGLFLTAGNGVFWRSRVALASIPALLLVISANLDRIESFKASFPTSASIEAKTRELTQTVDEAKEAIRQIRELGVSTAEALIDLRVNSNALLVGSPGIEEYREQDQFKRSMIEALKRMGLPEDRLNEVAHSDRAVVIRFYAYALYRFGRDTLPQTRWSEFDTAYYQMIEGSPEHAPPPDDCQALLDTFHIDSTKFADYMADFRHYWETGEQRRPEIWANRSRWDFGIQPQ